MKEHSNNFETEIKTYGRQQAVQVIFEQDGQQVVLDNENVFSVTPNFKASLLKTAMKGLILDCNVEIPVGTRLQFKYGILVNNAYEYLNFGYYIVNKIEKKEDTRSYEITCYDKMMLAMVDYIDIGIEYPITIRNYIAEICNHLEIDFGSNQDQFVNYDKVILNELYLDENGNSLDYTFRDVLDELAQVTASVICIGENDNLVVKYPQLNGDYETIEGTSLYIENADDNKIDLELKGNTTQNGTPTPSSPVPVNNVTGLQTITISNGTDSKDYEINLGKNLANPSDFKFYTQANASCSYDYDTNTLTMTTLREVTSSELFFCSKIDDNLLKDGKTYILSNVNVSGVVTSLKLQLRNKNGTNANKPQGTSITYDNNYSLFIVGNPFASSGSTVVPQGTIAVIKEIQVEERKCSN